MEVRVKQLLVINAELNTVKCTMTNGTIKLIILEQCELIKERNPGYSTKWYNIETGIYKDEFQNGNNWIVAYEW